MICVDAAGLRMERSDKVVFDGLDVTISRGDRIAQLVVHRLPAVTLEEVEELPDTVRGAGGFGHTGTR